MRILKWLLLILMVISVPLSGNAQESDSQELSAIQENNQAKQLISLSGELQNLEKIYDANIFYKSSEVQNKYVAKVEGKSQDLEASLDNLLKHLDMDYRKLTPTSFVVFEKEEVKKVQQETISGTVTDGQSGETLPGVNILVKGTSTGASTDADGNFELTVESLQDTLVVSFVGYQTQEIPIGGRTEIDVALQTQAITGEEMVVVGYGTQRKSDLTGSVTSIRSKEMNNQSASNPASTLQGKLPGLKVLQGSGEPGNEDVSLQIRGQGTFSRAGNDPLIIIDGIPGDLRSLNPQDIGEVTVLKDAASASIYGARAANGVILITTKKGSTNDLQLEYDFNIGRNVPTKMFDLITNSAQYMRMFNKAASHNGSPKPYTQKQINEYANATDRNKYPNTDWLDIIFNSAYVQNHYLGMSGGNESTRFRMSLGYLNKPGVMIGFNYNKYTVQFNLNSDISERIHFGSNLNLRNGNRLFPRTGAQDQFLSAMTMGPLYGPKLTDGSGRYTSEAYGNVYRNKNPVAIAENVQATTKSYRAQGSIFLNIDFTKHLSGNIRGGINVNQNKQKEFKPVIPQYGWFSGKVVENLNVGRGGTGLDELRNDRINPIIHAQFKYNNNWNGNKLNVLLGGEQEYFSASHMNGSRQEFPSNDLYELDAGGAEGQTVNGSSYSWALRSLFSRINYSYENRYLLQANFRYDGSSRFPKRNRWAGFPSLSAGWRISEEPFMSSFKWLNELKFRASWGKLGNQNIGNYPYQQVLNIGSNYPFNSSLITGVTPSSLVDKSIKWETTKMTNIGFNLSILHDKLSFTADWYQKETYDILRGAQVPVEVGLSAPTINNGQVNNNGFEFSVIYQQKVGALNFNINANLQRVNNKLVKFGKTEIGSYNIYKEGEPYGIFYLYDWIGIFQSEEEVQNSPTQLFNPKPGDLKFRDINGDGKINTSDKIPVKGRYPSFTYGINLSASYKGLDMSASFYGVQGSKRFIQNWGVEPFTQSSPPTTDWLKAWTPENRINDMPALYKGGLGAYPPIDNMPSTYFLKNNSYFRLRNLTIGYSLSNNFINKIGTLRGLRFYFQGQNLFTVTNYPYLDPEQTGGSFTGFISYPQNKVYSLGIQVKF